MAIALKLANGEKVWLGETIVKFLKLKLKNGENFVFDTRKNSEPLALEMVLEKIQEAHLFGTILSIDMVLKDSTARNLTRLTISGKHIVTTEGYINSRDF